MSNRNLRMSDVFQFDAFSMVRKEVIGVGAIGGMICKQLAYMGIENVTLWDFDTVEEHNCGNQGFSEDHIGTLKTWSRINDAETYNCAWVAHKEYWDFTVPAAIYFVCVDSLEARKQVYDALPKGSIIIDTRMLSLHYAVYTVKGKSPAYEESLDPEGLVEGSCTTRSTLHAANLAATLAVTQAMHHISGRNVPFLIRGDLQFYEQEVTWSP